MNVKESTQFKKEKITLKSFSNNEVANIDLFKLDSGRKGPELYIQSSLHGAELQGSAVIFQLMNYFFTHDFFGRITFVPQCNPLAVNNKSGTYTKGRFHPVTGVNFNRKFFDLDYLKDNNLFNLEEFVKKNKTIKWEELKEKFKSEIKIALKKIKENSRSYGFSDHDQLALTLQSLAVDSDIVLDLHTASTGADHLYIAEYIAEKSHGVVNLEENSSLKKLEFPFNIIIPNKFCGAFDESNFSKWHQLYEELKKQKISIPMSNQFEAFTLELGDEEKINFKKANQQCLRILNYLEYKGMIKKNDLKNINQSSKTEKKYYSSLKNFKSYFSPQGGLIEYTVVPGQIVKKGETIAKILSFSKLKDMKSLDKCICLIKANNDCAIVTIVSSSNISEGTEIIQVLENLSPI